MKINIRQKLLQFLMKKGEYILLFSPRACELYGYNKALTNDGKKVSYTCMHNLKEFGHNWKKSYRWPDTVVVGYMDDYKQIVEYHINPLDIDLEEIGQS